MVNCINKGKNFERIIANYLTELTGKKYNRVPMSGAFATINKSKNPVFNGDVFTEDDEYKNIVIECKSYSKLDINEMFSEHSKFYKWILQAETESKGNDWLLFIKIKSRGIFLVAKTFNIIVKKYFRQYPMIMVSKDSQKYMMFKIK